jgi:hypothetical protein
MTAGDKYLITTDAWFTAPDGMQYRSAWGSVEIISDSFLGIKTNRNSTNWYARVGSEERHIIIAGCQIHYAIKSDRKPNDGSVEAWSADASNGIKVYKEPSRIYIAE